MGNVRYVCVCERDFAVDATVAVGACVKREKERRAGNGLWIYEECERDSTYLSIYVALAGETGLNTTYSKNFSLWRRLN